MFLHLGGNAIISKKEIIAILNIYKKPSAITSAFLDEAQDKGVIDQISDLGKEKSCVIANDKIYISPISCNTLRKRTIVD